MHETLLIIDDEPGIRAALERLLTRRGYRVETAASGEEGIRKLEDGEIQLVITDLTLEPLSGLDVLRWVRNRSEEQGGSNVDPPVILMTAYGSERSAVEAMKLGALDYLPKPFDNDELVLVVERALEEGRLRRDLDLLREEVGDRYRFHRLIGRSAAMRGVFERIRRVADTDLTVLVRGPSGTGKELVANAIHYNSSRRRRPLITVNCAAFSRELVESELFGHEQGAFTGATRARQGKFELADGGSLFLDEIGDMALETQAKVLRVLQEQRFERVGGNHTHQVDVRILAATNQDLEALIERGDFRRDLFYRLNVVPIDLPPLRERPEDLPLLIDHFLVEVADRLGRPRRTLDPTALRLLLHHDWQGNVRELLHAIEHAVALAGGDAITPGDLPASCTASTPAPCSPRDERNFKAAKEHVIESFEREFVTAALERSAGNVTRAAEEMGMYRQHLQMKLAKLAIDPADFRR